jgi:cycloeucalenol cycloisomerase
MVELGEGQQPLSATFQAMGTIFASITIVLMLLSRLLKPRIEGAKGHSGRMGSTWLANGHTPVGRAKRATETWFLSYGIFWITCFAAIVGGGMYKWFDKHHYIGVCLGLAMPLYLQPLLWPCLTKEQHVPLMLRHSFKANIWLSIFGFVGNYWYTHYFYSVLEARYTMPSWDLNGVPVAMFFATHFYFTFYHALSNCLIRKVVTTYEATTARDSFCVVTILVSTFCPPPPLFVDFVSCICFISFEFCS